MWALIPCAGSGSRARTALPKQYQPVAGKAVVLHTLAAFDGVARIAATLVVVSTGDDFLATCGAAGRWTTAPCGGATRAQTVANGLAELQARGAADDDWVLVHDAARCLVTPELIDRLIDACQHDAPGGLLAHPVADTLKQAAGKRVRGTTDRSTHWLAQTPQMFRIATLRHALASAGDLVTDESSAIERLGLAPLLVPGSAQNFKLTYPEDFLLAQTVLRARARPPTPQDLDYDYP
jgi:2-C-methyl-D-erythritol 4-phosphate cytidylyltransferase